MTPRKPVMIAPSSEWRRPAGNWVDIVERYISYVQVPAWRVNALTRNGSKTRPCIPAVEAEQLRAKMLRVIDGIARRRSTHAAKCAATEQDLAGLIDYHGRHVPKADRCSREIRERLQRAFLLNAAGYTCLYCGRTAWGVYAEKAGTEPPRTLRFEIDHRTPRREVAGADQTGNLVVACRSCNTIKGEMIEERFLAELRSLAAAVERKF